MSSPFSPQETRRHARYRAWALAAVLWLMRIAGPILDARYARQRGGVTLARLERMVRNLIILHAVQYLPAPADARTRKHYGPVSLRRCSNRAVAGAFLRRRLRKRGALGEQLAHLAHVLRTLDTLAMRFARHRRRGLSKLAPAPRAPRTIFMLASYAPAYAQRAPDSS